MVVAVLFVICVGFAVAFVGVVGVVFVVALAVALGLAVAVIADCDADVRFATASVLGRALFLFMVPCATEC